MKPETLQRLAKILDDLSAEATTLMPMLHQDFEGHKAWPLIQTMGLYLHHWGVGRTDMQTGGNEPDIMLAHQFALANIMGHPAVQNLIQQAISASADRFSGVEW